LYYCVGFILVDVDDNIKSRTSFIFAKIMLKDENDARIVGKDLYEPASNS